jgi:uncharacterized repeat protein (TIGR01451 family)
MYKLLRAAVGIALVALVVQPAPANAASTCVLQDDTYHTDVGQTLVVTAPGFLANDTLACPGFGFLDSPDFPTQGTLSSVGPPVDGGFTYIPTGSFHGTDSFKYGYHDNDTGEEIKATVTIHVDLLDAVDDTYNMDKGTTLTGDVLDNDTTEAPSFNTQLTDSTDFGLLTYQTSTGHFDYTPTNPAFTGVDTFTYRLFDANNIPYGDSATVTINVNEPTIDADLSITKTDGVTSVDAGATTTYTITASNAGPDAAVGTTVADTLPATLTGVTWTSLGTPGVTGNDASGVGNINDVVDLPSGASVTYVVSATVSASATGSLANTATVAAASGVTDSNTGNNSATDTDTISADPSADPDHDGLTNAEEATEGTDPNDSDTDNDGLKDGRELDGFAKCAAGTDPLKKDTDGDGLADYAELIGLTLTQKVSLNEKVPANAKAIGLVRTNPCAKDTDGDKLTDKQEVTGISINQKVIRAKKYGPYTITTRKTNPLLKDTDKDGLSDRQEVTGDRNTAHGKHKSDPTAADTDWGGAKDGAEIQRGSDPTVADA